MEPAQDRQGWPCQHSLMDCGRAQEVPPLLGELWAVNGLLGQGNTFLQWSTHWQVVQSLVSDLPPRLIRATIIELHTLMTLENKNPCLDVLSIKKKFKNYTWKEHVGTPWRLWMTPHKCSVCAAWSQWRLAQSWSSQKTAVTLHLDWRPWRMPKWLLVVMCQEKIRKDCGIYATKECYSQEEVLFSSEQCRKALKLIACLWFGLVLNKNCRV